MHDVRLVAIASTPFVDPHSIVDACRAAEAGGVTSVQVRLKDVAAAECLRATEALLESLAIPVYVNDRADVALAAGAHGVHLGSEDVDPVLVRPFAPRPFRIGTSVGTPGEAAAVLEADVDYWSTGAVYRTPSKSDAGSPIGLAGFQDLARRAPKGMPVIAIGGITVSNAAEILRAGAQGIAVISAVFGAPDVERASRELRAIVDAELCQR